MNIVKIIEEIIDREVLRRRIEAGHQRNTDYLVQRLGQMKAG